MGSYCAALNPAGWKMAQLDNKVSSSSSEDWKMTRYLSGRSIIRFSSFLAWTGLVSSVLFIIGSLDMILTPLAVGVHRYSGGCGRYFSYSLFCGSLYGVGSVTLLINIGIFIYSFKLWKAISSDNMKEMRNLIKTGCYIMGSLELLTTVAAGVITPIVFIIQASFFYRGYDVIIGLLTIPIIVSVGVILMISLMIDGVRKFKPGHVNVYIIFKLAIFIIFAIGTLIQVVMGVSIGPIGWLLGINQLLLGGFFYFYCTGFMVVQYNIMLDGLTEEGSLELTQGLLQFSNNVYFHDNENTNYPANPIYTNNECNKM